MKVMVSSRVIPLILIVWAILSTFVLFFFVWLRRRRQRRDGCCGYSRLSQRYNSFKRSRWPSWSEFCVRPSLFPRCLLAILRQGVMVLLVLPALLIMLGAAILFLICGGMLPYLFNAMKKRM